MVSISRNIRRSTSFWMIALTFLVVISFATLWFSHPSSLTSDYSSSSYADVQRYATTFYSSPSSAQTAEEYIRIGSLLDIPPDDAPPNIPTPPLTAEQLANQAVANRVSAREELGYKGDKDALHLGGFTALDMEGISPNVWKDMMEYIGVRSLLDIGCGKGVSTAWFYLQGVESFCAEGSQDALRLNLMPKVIQTEDGIDMEIQRLVIEHDFSRGPWWPSKTVDAVWCVEFLEHVGRPLMYNYMVAMKRAAVIFATHSTWGGWHHTEVHQDPYWISKFESVGFRFSRELTERYRKLAADDGNNPNLIKAGENYHPAHLFRTLLVFINPAVAARKEHRHLFSEGGCFDDYDKPTFHCGDKGLDERTVLPPEWRPIPFKEDKEKEWAEVVKSSLVA